MLFTEHLRHWALPKATSPWLCCPWDTRLSRKSQPIGQEAGSKPVPARLRIVLPLCILNQEQSELIS